MSKNKLDQRNDRRRIREDKIDEDNDLEIPYRRSLIKQHYNDFRAKIEEQKKEIEEANQIIEEKNHEYDELLKENNHLKNQILDYQKQIQDLSIVNDQQKKALENSSSKISALNNQVETFSKELKSLKKSVPVDIDDQEIRDTIDHLNEELDQKDNEIEMLKKRIEQLENNEKSESKQPSPNSSHKINRQNSRIAEYLQYSDSISVSSNVSNNEANRKGAKLRKTKVSRSRVDHEEKPQNHRKTKLSNKMKQSMPIKKSDASLASPPKGEISKTSPSKSPQSYKNEMKENTKNENSENEFDSLPKYKRVPPPKIETRFLSPTITASSDDDYSSGTKSATARLNMNKLSPKFNSREAKSDDDCLKKTGLLRMQKDKKLAAKTTTDNEYDYDEPSQTTKKSPNKRIERSSIDNDNEEPSSARRSKHTASSKTNAKSNSKQLIKGKKGGKIHEKEELKPRIDFSDSNSKTEDYSKSVKSGRTKKIVKKVSKQAKKNLNKKGNHNKKEIQQNDSDQNSDNPYSEDISQDEKPKKSDIKSKTQPLNSGRNKAVKTNSQKNQKSPDSNRDLTAKQVKSNQIKTRRLAKRKSSVDPDEAQNFVKENNQNVSEDEEKRPKKVTKKKIRHSANLDSKNLEKSEDEKSENEKKPNKKVSKKLKNVEKSDDEQPRKSSNKRKTINKSYSKEKSEDEVSDNIPEKAKKRLKKPSLSIPTMINTKKDEKSPLNHSQIKNSPMKEEKELTRNDIEDPFPKKLQTQPNYHESISSRAIWLEKELYGTGKIEMNSQDNKTNIQKVETEVANPNSTTVMRQPRRGNRRPPTIL
ncbi:hypothetical protein TRFO_33886 [Tritrichomonas foetus]|uniref:Uncharacterized protein n=1 Tax=Tritrichomonas foetus TaxID=1144522 RepID=A0A1J4JKD7_9EUKA|nr:hypothetical protein TRFO_33886 [Tritrichomonas foetus]|eukprot:OHS99600.1 hypothetical protein TRFO_33886 [Tritrichomonas foetus]